MSAIRPGSAGSGGGGGGGAGTWFISLGGKLAVDATQGTVVAGGSPGALDPATYAATGQTQTWTLTVTASVVSGQTGTIVLRNLTDTADAVTITVTATGPTAHTASVTLPASAKLYELRASCTGTLASHYLSIESAALKVARS